MAERERDEAGRPRNARPRDRTGKPLERGAADEMAGRVEPDDVVDSVAAALAEAVRLVDAERYFEAHEFLEWIWKSGDVAEGDRDFWKGVTQIVVAGVHVQRGNPDGALRLAGRGVRFLSAYPDGHAGVDTAALRHDAEVLLEALAAGPPPASGAGGVALPRLRLLA